MGSEWLTSRLQNMDRGGLIALRVLCAAQRTRLRPAPSTPLRRDEMAILVVLAVALAVGRIFIVPTPNVSWSHSYQAFAHVFVGFLIGGAAFGHSHICGWTAAAITMWEAVWFFGQKFKLWGRG
jgi:hypothetical protein